MLGGFVFVETQKERDITFPYIIPVLAFGNYPQETQKPNYSVMLGRPFGQRKKGVNISENSVEMNDAADECTHKSED